MTEQQGDQLLALLDLMRVERAVQHAKDVALLTDIRDALVPLPVAMPCPHEERHELSSMTEIEWICKACTFHFGPIAKGQTNAAVSQ